MPRSNTYHFEKDGGTSGRFTTFADTSPGGSVDFFRATRDDTQGERGGIFTTNKYYSEGGIINLDWTDYYAPWFHNYVCDFVRSFSEDWTGHMATNSPSSVEVALQTVKRTSPSRPRVDLGQNIGELRDFPQLFRSAGKQLLDVRKPGRLGKSLVPEKGQPGIDSAAEAFLNLEFGWKPLLSDVKKLLDFGAQIDKRVKELNNLKRKGGLRRTTRFGKKSDNYEFVTDYDGFATVQSVHRLIQVPIHIRTTERVWSFINWFPEIELPENSASMRKLARRAVYAIEADASTAWELFPFSWLADWCTNIGDLLVASRNIIPASHGFIQVMRSFNTVLQTPGWDDGNGLTMSPIFIQHESKTRRIASPSFEAHFPFLDARKVSILGSIGLLKSKSSRTFGI